MHFHVNSDRLTSVCSRGLNLVWSVKRNFIHHYNANLPLHESVFGDRTTLFSSIGKFRNTCLAVWPCLGNEAEIGLVLIKLSLYSLS